MVDQQLICEDCGESFIFSDGEQDFYASKHLRSPRRCKGCRGNRKDDRADGTITLHDAVCAQCGASCQVPFVPRPVEEGDRPVLCKGCFSALRPA